jgi:TRAP-type mannitol/chloroaromatic compound transport system permease small subunit
MHKYLLAIDSLSTWVGKTFAWSIVLLTFAVSYEVFVRYAFNAPTTWAFDASYILYGTLFMMGGAYTLSRNGHVRGDFIYRMWPIRRQAAVDLVLYCMFYVPAMAAFVYSGWDFFWLSFRMNEHSAFSPEGPIIWPFKFLIPLVGVLMLLQGFAEIMRCIETIQTGKVPSKLHDVEELEKQILAEAEAARAKKAKTERKGGK